MPDGICEAGYVLDGSACGSWLDADGNEPQGGTFLGTDEQMIDAGYTCDSSCVQIDHYHRSYEDAAACADITAHYTHSTNCCEPPPPSPPSPPSLPAPPSPPRCDVAHCQAKVRCLSPSPTLNTLVLRSTALRPALTATPGRRPQLGDHVQS